MFSGGANISFYAFYTFYISCISCIFSSCISFYNTFYSAYALYTCRDDYGIDYCEYASNGHSIHKLRNMKDTQYSILHTRSEVCGWDGQKHNRKGK